MGQRPQQPQKERGCFSASEAASSQGLQVRFWRGGVVMTHTTELTPWGKRHRLALPLQAKAGQGGAPSPTVRGHVPGPLAQEHLGLLVLFRPVTAV